MLITAFVEIAIEEAMRLKDAGNATEVIAVSGSVSQRQESSVWPITALPAIFSKSCPN